VRLSRVRLGVVVAGFDETSEQRMGPQGFRLELRVELHRNVPRMIGQFDNLDKLPVE